MNRKCWWLGAFVLIFLPVVGNAADLDESGSAVQKESDQPRFMLGDSASAKQTANATRQPTEEDFTWGAISNNGPAAGKDPIVGKAKVHSYYDFKDGQANPNFVVEEKK